MSIILVVILLLTKHITHTIDCPRYIAFTFAGVHALGSTLASYDEAASASSAFRVLRTMVNSWLREVSQFRNVFADYQIVHFYRWLR